MKIKQCLDWLSRWCVDWDIRYILKIWSIWMIGIYLVSGLIIDRVPLGSTYTINEFQEGQTVWTNWDGNNYIVIARDGYLSGPESLYAFFPLFPWLIQCIQLIPGVSYPLAGALVTRLATFGFLVFLVRLVSEQWGKKIAYRTAWFILIFPTSFFFFATYTESLFLFLTLGTWYFARQRRWVLAAIFGLFAPLSRLVGIFTMVILMWEYLSSIQWRWRQIRWPILAFLAPIFGLGIYMVQNLIQNGDPLFFLEVQKYWAEIHGRGGYHNPIFIIGLEVARVIGSLPERHIYLIGDIDTWFTIIPAFVLIFAGWKRILPWEFMIWSWLVWIIPVISGSLVSMPRYVTVLFPVTIVCAIQAEQSSVFERAYIWISALVMAVLLTRFVFIGHWVA